MNTMRAIPEMVTDLRSLSDYYCGTDGWALLNDAANYIEGASSSLREHMQMLTEMRVRLEQVRPLMEEAAEELAALFWRECPDEEGQYKRDMTLPNAIRAMLRWWEPRTAEPASISHWGIVE